MNQPRKLIALCIVILLWLSNNASAQITIPGKTYPFNIDYLAYSSTEVQQNPSVIPVYRTGAFVYINRRTGQALFRKKFQEAYPFVRGYGLVKAKGLYGIINTKGMYVIKPKYPEFKLNQRFGGARIVFRNDTAFGFDYILKAEVPYRNKDYRMPPFSAVKIGKEVALYYEYNNDVGSLNKPLLFCDSLLGSTYDQAIIMKGGKIGAVNPKGETVIPFEYTEYSTNPYLSPGVYGPSPLLNMPINFALCKEQDWYYYHESKF